MDRYQVLHHLGSGSFGTVAVAIEKASGFHVAMKFIDKGSKQETEIANLKKECEIQKYLRHPNVIQMLDSFETDKNIVVVTELAHGDLYKVTPQNTRWDPKIIKKIACDLVSALHFLHSQRILHRDLKPQNILVGIDGRAKLCDFGFAKMIAINSFMLTSMKGTPLYMAPEIIMEKPYDQTADLWSLGCILYELFVGQPPFHTNSLFVLRTMMIEGSIKWHHCIGEDALPFLKGLLNKDPKKRLNWPDLLNHPYVRGKLTIDWSVAEYALTKALSPSQELVKESERQHLQNELEQCSRVYRKAMKKYAQAQQKLKRWNSDAAITRGRPVVPLINVVPPPTTSKPPPQNLEAMLEKLKLQEDTATNKTGRKTKDEKGNSDKEPSEATGTSSSDCDTESDEDSDEDDRKTVVPDEIYQKKSTDSRKSGGSNLQRHSVEIMGDDSEAGGSKVLFTLDTSGSTECVTDTGEWMCFLVKTMKEVLDNPETLCDKAYLTMIMGPLKSTSAEAIVLEKIAVLLSLPFTLEDKVLKNFPGLIGDLQTLYVSMKVLPLLLFACKLIVVNRVNGQSLTLEQICEQLTEEDLNGLEKCFRLVTFMVHMDEQFVTQFCDSVCVLKLSAILQLFLKLTGTRVALAVETVTVLCHLLRIFPNNKSIVEDVVLGGQSKRNDIKGVRKHQELWKLISHSDPLLQSKCIRLFTYLLHNSPRCKQEFVERHKPAVWNILRRATFASNAQLRQTAKFALQVVNDKALGDIDDETTIKTAAVATSCCQQPQNGQNGMQNQQLCSESVEANQAIEVQNVNANSGSKEELRCTSTASNDASR